MRFDESTANASLNSTVKVPELPLQCVYGVDLFAGAGGLSLGARWAGINVLCAIENNREAAATYRKNHPHTEVLVKDISDVISFPQLPHAKPLILFGGPPCQGFSTSNQKTRTFNNPRNWLFKEVFRVADILNPDCIVLENVTGLKGTAKGEFFLRIKQEFCARNYKVDVWNLCSSDYGVPQRRNRLFIIGHRFTNPLLPPEPNCKAAVTVRQAINDLPLLKAGASINELSYRSVKPSQYAASCRDKETSCSGHLVTKNNDLVLSRYAHIPPGGNWRNIPKDLMHNYTNLVDGRSRHTGIYHRLEWNKPSVVIANFRKNMLIHPEQNRGLSLREAARIQSFPDSYEFIGSIGFQQQQISNAVPPMLAKAVFSKIICSL